MRHCRSHRLLPALLLLLLTPVASAATEERAEDAAAFKILVEDDGVYRVGYAALAEAGLTGPTPSAGLGLRAGGEEVPIFVEDGGDGELGPGDAFEFVGRRLVGERSFVHDYAWLNVYRLHLEGGGARMVENDAASDDAATVARRARARRHLEEDTLLIRLSGKQAFEEDSWFWTKMVHNRPEPTRLPLRLPGLAADGRVDLEITVRGWSRPHNKAAPDIADHALVVKLDNPDGRGRVLGQESWNGDDEHRLRYEDLPASLFGPESELHLMVPMRKEAREERALIDVILLNAVDLVYDHGDTIPADGVHLEFSAGSAGPAEGGGALRLAGDGALTYYGAGGRRLSARTARIDQDPSAWIVAPDRLEDPVAVVADAPSTLRSKARRADYLMIVPHVFKEAIAPLAELHRERGLDVEVIEVEDVYDEFNHSIAHPRAIRDFIAWAHGSWRRPAPRFVLLVGDASWDVKNAEAVDAHYADWTYRRGESRDFGKNESTPYEGATGRSRHFIPTWQTSTGQGHAASDNYFVDPDEDGVPDLAIGRFPVASVEELEPIVAKIRRYVNEPDPGAWRRDLLFVTNEQKRYQQRSDRLADELAEIGFTPQKIYPASQEKSNAKNTEALVEALSSGQLLVHFVGHGGRYIGRTGPPDFEKNHDLFTLEDLDRLPPNDRLSVVVSLTCYSAPFDHPTADSIGEKFLRMDRRGAIGVIAASWRNSPTPAWSQTLLRQLTRPGVTLGEALLAAKQEIGSRMFRETYLLLGDPAVPVALPPGLEPAAVEARADESRDEAPSASEAPGRE